MMFVLMKIVIVIGGLQATRLQSPPKLTAPETAWVVTIDAGLSAIASGRTRQIMDYPLGRKTIIPKIILNFEVREMDEEQHVNIVRFFIC
jgi:hypothetical protein